MRYLALFLFLSVSQLSMQAQCLLPSGEPDTLFPVTNLFNTYRSPYSGSILDEGASVYSIKSYKGIYYIFGNFNNISKNQGSALVIDSATNAVFTPQKWRINGSVKGAIADGSGGFFIYGTFSKIGDSTRNYLAQIDSYGRPTAWNPKADQEVRALYKKGDTLIMSGAFSSVFGKPKTYMAMYSLSGDSLIKVSLPTFQVGKINCFLLQNDTLIIGGYSSSGQAIRKYNFKDGVMLPWQLDFKEYGEIWQLGFNQDSSCFLYTSDYNGVYIKGVNTQSGKEKYKIEMPMNPGNFPITHVVGFTVMGNKAYAVGRFDAIRQPSSFIRKGFFAFDPLTGTILPDDIKADGYPTFIQAANGRLFLSGRFTTISGVKRENFAVIDTGTLQAGSWQLAPTDQLTCLAFSGNSSFVAGYFNGINSVHRNGFAAIDSATNTILPWAPSSAGFVEGKRMLIKGDTLFVLGFTNQNISCYQMMNGNDFTSLLQLIRISTGENIVNGVGGINRVNDILIDGNYLYVAGDNQVRRYILASMTQDPGWGTNFDPNGEPTPMVLIMSANKLYTAGDNRFLYPCTTLPKRKGYLTEYDKSTGYIQKGYDYQGTNVYYDQITFEHSLLLGSKLFVHGYFNSLNGKSRKNFVLLDVNSGQISDWYTPFSESGTEKNFQWTSDLKWYNNKIFFSANSWNGVQWLPGRGLLAIDTATGQLLPSLIELRQYFVNSNKTERFHDFLFDGNSFIGVGGYDSVNGRPVSNIAKMHLVNYPSTGQTNISITGPDTMYVGTTKKFHILNADRKTNTYSWSYTGKGLTIQNNGSDTITVKADSIFSGQLSVVPIGYCQTGSPISRNLVVVMPPLPALPVVLNVSDKCRSASTSYGKLANPPADVTIAITQDGSPLTYDPTDSSFKYFDNWTTPAGSHTISVKYANSSGSSVRDSIYMVQQPTSWTATISTPSTTVCTGAGVTFNATTSLNGTHTYQWHINGANAGTNASTFTTTSLSNGSFVHVTITPPSGCITPLSQTSNVITMTVSPSVTASLSISATTVVRQGDASTITASLTNGGNNPALLWQDSTVAHGWQDVANVAGSSVNYTPAQTGDKIRCRLTSNAACAQPNIVTSNVLIFTVTVATAINPVTINTYGVRYYPNPVHTVLYVDSLSAVQKWNLAEVFCTDGTRMRSIDINGRSQVIVPVEGFSSGYYILVLHRKSGESAYLKFLKF